MISQTLRLLSIHPGPSYCWCKAAKPLVAAFAIWPEIHSRSDFVTDPGELLDAASDHLMVATNERGSCRRRSADGRCLADDFLFSVGEQRNQRLTRDPRVTDLEVQKGHAAIVGEDDRPPVEWTAILQGHGIMSRTPSDREVEVQALLSRLYRLWNGGRGRARRG